MFARDARRRALYVAPTLVLLYYIFSLYNIPVAITTQGNDRLKSADADLHEDTRGKEDSGQLHKSPQELSEDPWPLSDETPPNTPGELAIVAEDVPKMVAEFQESILDDAPTAPPALEEDAVILPVTNESIPSSLDIVHQELFGLSTFDSKFFTIDMGETQTMNPNIIPHPTLDDTYIVVAQEVNEREGHEFVELFCAATFQDGALRCLLPPAILPVAATTGDLCEGEMDFLNVNVGPHDARVFFGPDKPYAVFGSNSDFTCFGQFIQDLRTLIDWGPEESVSDDFSKGTEMQRPPPWNNVEKNWFLFWDADGLMYVHYDVSPKRAFAQLVSDGSVGQDLSPFSEASDEKCLARYMPQLAQKLESIHQATNSLQITMCKRSDEACVPDGSNTFIFTIFQHKTFYNFHSVYEPYVMVFRRRAPFEIYAISTRPLWIHGREQHDDTADMFYITSMSWKERGRKYGGYLDDELFLAFGIEDQRAGGIDLVAGHLLESLGMCDDLLRTE